MTFDWPCAYICADVDPVLTGQSCNISMVKVKVKFITSPMQWPVRLVLIPGFCSMKRLGVFLLPPGWDASLSQGYPQHFAGTHLYIWVERGTVRVKCLA